MGIAVSLLLIALGAILAWAVNAEPSGLDLDAVGIILIVVGLVGFVLSLLWWQSWWAAARSAVERPTSRIRATTTRRGNPRAGGASSRKRSCRPGDRLRAHLPRRARGFQAPFRPGISRPKVSAAMYPAIFGFSCKRLIE